MSLALPVLSCAHHFQAPATQAKQDIVTKSKQTQYGRKYDGRFHTKKDRPPNPFMPGNVVTMLIFEIKRIN